MLVAILALRRTYKWQLRLGWFGASLVPLMAGAGVFVAFWGTRRDIATGQTAVAVPFFLGNLMDMFLFAYLPTWSYPSLVVTQ